jgi:hypothetical protein
VKEYKGTKYAKALQSKWLGRVRTQRRVPEAQHRCPVDTPSSWCTDQAPRTSAKQGQFFPCPPHLLSLPGS